MSKIQYVLIALAAAVVILAAGSIYTVNQGEQALVLQFGRPVRVVKEPTEAQNSDDSERRFLRRAAAQP